MYQSINSVASPPSEKSKSRSKGVSHLTKAQILKKIVSNQMPILYQVRAKYDFKGQKEYDMEFKAGDMINVFGENDTGHWCLGRSVSSGCAGMFPVNHVEKCKKTIVKGFSSGKLKYKKGQKDVYKEKYQKTKTSTRKGLSRRKKD